MNRREIEIFLVELASTWGYDWRVSLHDAVAGQPGRWLIVERLLDDDRRALCQMLLPPEVELMHPETARSAVRYYAETLHKWAQNTAALGQVPT